MQRSKQRFQTRATVQLTREQDRQIREETQNGTLTIADVIRAAVADYLRRRQHQQPATT
jgi:Arc/MetJ-type ribon-helix-helix transcriptional regulator